MKLSAPVYHLKRQARLLSRAAGIPLHAALDRIARQEGIATWSLLATRAFERRPGHALLAELAPGELLLLGARPGHGKTLLSLELAVEAMDAGRLAHFFSLESTAPEMDARFAVIGADPKRYADRFTFDGSDSISADHIVGQLTRATRGDIAVIDYLQLLDQRRDNPTLAEQIPALRTFARACGVMIVCISQIDRRFEPGTRECPDLSDVRLPNPLDLRLFDKACFVNNGVLRMAATG